MRALQSALSHVEAGGIFPPSKIVVVRVGDECMC